MKKIFTVADVNNIISALTCYVINDFNYKQTLADIEHTVGNNKDVIEHLSYCMDIIKHNK